MSAERRRREVGPREEDGSAAFASAAEKKEKEREGEAGHCGKKWAEEGWATGQKGEGKEEGFWCFFSFFKLFFKLFPNFANFTQTNIKPCIQIMMLKHLLLLKLLK
jgi:hypothetical protein